MQHDAISDNPVRHLDPIEAGSRKPWALTAEERRRFLVWIHGTSEKKEQTRAQAAAHRRDLPNFLTFTLGTGVRIGEAVAVRWCDVDLDGVPVIEGDSPRAVPIGGLKGGLDDVAGHEPHVPKDSRGDLARLRRSDGAAEGRLTGHAKISRLTDVYLARGDLVRITPSAAWRNDFDCGPVGDVVTSPAHRDVPAPIGRSLPRQTARILDIQPCCNAT